MQHYIHHVPGRVRMKNPLFKNNPDLLREVEGCFQDTEGITRIQTNGITGSVVILYNPQVMPTRHMVEMLAHCEHIDASKAIGLDHHMKSSLDQAGRYAGKVGLSLFMDKALAGSGLSFVTALI